MAEESNDLSTREKVALGVIISSGVGISVVAVIAIWAGTYATTNDSRNLVMNVFNTLIPMFGTWVATVIAFYFSRENFVTAARETRQLVGQLGDDRLRQINVKDVWIGVPAIEAITVAGGQESTIPFSDVRAKLSNRISRLPVWDEHHVVRYVIHESVIYKFLATALLAAATPPTTTTPPTNTTPPTTTTPPAAATLKDFLDFASDGTTMQTVVSKIVWISSDSTLADAKEKMMSLPGCQDVFVTATGQSSEPVLGWLTNADIASKARM